MTLSSLALHSVSLKKTPLINCSSQSLKSSNFGSLIGLNNGVLRLKPRKFDCCRVFMRVSVGSPSETAMFSDYKPSSAFLFPGQAVITSHYQIYNCPQYLAS